MEGIFDNIEFKDNDNNNTNTNNAKNIINTNNGENNTNKNKTNKEGKKKMTIIQNNDPNIKMGFEERPCEWDGPGMLKMLR